MVSDKNGKEKQWYHLICCPAPVFILFLHLVIVWKNIIRTAEQKFIRINHDKLFYLEVVWLDSAERRISPLEMKNQIDDNDNDEIHLKNDLFNIQVYSFMSSSSNIKFNSQKNSSSPSIVEEDIWILSNHDIFFDLFFLTRYTCQEKWLFSCEYWTINDVRTLQLSTSSYSIRPV